MQGTAETMCTWLGRGWRVVNQKGQACAWAAAMWSQEIVRVSLLTRANLSLGVVFYVNLCKSMMQNEIKCDTMQIKL